jgi:hypothetical protein
MRPDWFDEMARNGVVGSGNHLAVTITRSG